MRVISETLIEMKNCLEVELNFVEGNGNTYEDEKFVFDGQGKNTLNKIEVLLAIYNEYRNETQSDVSSEIENFWRLINKDCINNYMVCGYKHFMWLSNYSIFKYDNNGKKYELSIDKKSIRNIYDIISEYKNSDE